MNTKLHTYYKCVRSLDPAPSYSIFGGTGSVSLHGLRLVESVSLLDTFGLFSSVLHFLPVMPVLLPLNAQLQVTKIKHFSEMKVLL